MSSACYSSIDFYFRTSAASLTIASFARLLILVPSLILSSHLMFAQQGEFDGPAELPRVHVKSSLADTPSPGKVIAVHAGDDLQSALNSAECGDRIELEAGATFGGNFRFPPKPCDDAHWITVRTSAPDTSLPPQGTRLTPCFAGVASLPGRPDFHCTAVKNVMAKIEFNRKSGMGPLIFLSGANHYRLIGLEVTRIPSPNQVSALTSISEGGQADHLVFDRVWMHGDAVDETTRALALVGSLYVAVIDSFFTDFHCIAVTGACTDAQVISDGGGRVPSGQFKIENNFLESSGENILFGGGGASMTPADIVIRHNYFFKPMIWKPGEPGFVAGASGHPFIIKNLFEIKNAQRVLFEDNVLENSWGGFSQNGYAMMLTPKNQGGHCPQCRVSDVTIRYVRVSNIGSLFSIANVADDDGSLSAQGDHYSIHDVLAENIRGNQDNFQGAGLAFQLLSISPLLHDIQIEHVTAFVPRAAFAIWTRGTKLVNFKIENNLLSTGQYSIVSSGGGAENCADRPNIQEPSGVFKSCLVNSSFTHNLMIGDGGWPSGNWSSGNSHGAGILETSDPKKPYEFCSEKSKDCKKASPGWHGGTDRKNVGADLDELAKRLAGVKSGVE